LHSSSSQAVFPPSPKKLPEHLANLPADLLEKREELEGRIKIGTVNDSKMKNDADEKVTEIKFHTYQDERDELNYRIRVTIEMTDRQKNTYFAQISRPPKPFPGEYTGESDWAFQIPHGDLERPKVSAYAIEYGFLDGSTFVPVAEEFDDVDCAEEITDRTQARINIKCTHNSHWYRDD
jgi:hypothetical protein